MKRIIHADIIERDNAWCSRKGYAMKSLKGRGLRIAGRSRGFMRHAL